jgi:quinol monooxygenase YgiN
MPFVVTARWVARPGEEDDVLRCIQALIGPSRAEPGCRFYQPNRDPDDPRTFFFYEIYDDEHAYRSHGESAHFRRFGLDDAIPPLETRERKFYVTVD